MEKRGNLPALHFIRSNFLGFLAGKRKRFNTPKDQWVNSERPYLVLNKGRVYQNKTTSGVRKKGRFLPLEKRRMFEGRSGRTTFPRTGVEKKGVLGPKGLSGGGSPGENEDLVTKQLSALRGSWHPPGKAGAFVGRGGKNLTQVVLSLQRGADRPRFLVEKKKKGNHPWPEQREKISLALLEFRPEKNRGARTSPGSAKGRAPAEEKNRSSGRISPSREKGLARKRRKRATTAVRKGEKYKVRRQVSWWGGVLAEEEGEGGKKGPRVRDERNGTPDRVLRSLWPGGAPLFPGP